MPAVKVAAGSQVGKGGKGGKGIAGQLGKGSSPMVKTPLVKTPSPGKEQLSHAAQLLVGRSLMKGEIVYECQQNMQGQFVATVSIVPTGAVYQGNPAAVQRSAENNAADAALRDLRPQLIPLEAAAKEKKAQKEKERAEMRELKQELGEADPAAAGIKRKPVSAPVVKQRGGKELGLPGGSASREKLAQAAQLLLGRSLKKGEIAFSAEDDGTGQFVGSVILTAYDAGTVHQGAPAADAKLAEEYAAAAALEALDQPIQMAQLEKGNQPKRERGPKRQRFR